MTDAEFMMLWQHASKASPAIVHSPRAAFAAGIAAGRRFDLLDFRAELHRANNRIAALERKIMRRRKP